ncbi:MAG: hypothetical protein LBS08_04800 [Candidatus Symbiothrix sp.]|nr:hypothetical protein [Candidatus Symbiothrix sp.]
MDFTPVFIVGFLVFGTYKMLELFVRKKERLDIIEKFTSLNLESAKPVRLPNILYEKQDYGSWPLRISLLLMGIGLGFLCTFFIQMYYRESIHWDQKRMLDFASIAFSIAFFGGLGLFIAFLIELKQKNKQSKEDND